jgi:hypothetical protein
VKYRTFVLIRNLLVAGALVLGGFVALRGCGALLDRREEVVRQPIPPAFTRPQTASPPVASQPVPAPTSGPRPRATPAANTGAPERQEVDRLHSEVLAMAKEPLSKGEAAGDSRRWRVKRGRLVIELRSDTAKGSKTWNRAKIDLDGDKQFDEAWDIRPDGEVKRRVAPGDDENYTATYDLRGNTWVKR